MNVFIMVLFALWVGQSAPAWEWPIAEGDGVDLSVMTERAAAEAGVFRFRVTGDGGRDVSVVTPTEGDVIYRGPVFRATAPSPPILPDVPSLVVRTTEEFWVIQHIHGSTFRRSEETVLLTVGGGYILGRAPSFSFSLYDARNNRYVNPRAVLPLTDAVGRERMPEIRLVQNNAYVTAANLAPGPIEFVVPLNDSILPYMPRSISISRNGNEVAFREFIFADEVVGSVSPSRRWLVLGSADVTAGGGRFLVEGVRFDGSVTTRYIDYTVPAPAMEEEIGAP